MFRINLILLATIFFLTSSVVFSHNQGNPPCSETLSKTVQTTPPPPNRDLRIKQWAVKPTYIIDRDFADYRDIFSSFGFAADMMNLIGGRWLDVGPGEGLAMRYFIKDHPNVLSEVVAVEPEWGANALKYHFIDNPNVRTQFSFFEASVMDVPKEHLGLFDRITDVIAAASYAPQGPLGIVIRYLQLLKVGGNARISIPPISIFEGGQKYSFAEWVEKHGGEKVKIHEDYGHTWATNKKGQRHRIVEITRLDSDISEFERVKYNAKIESAGYPPKWIIEIINP